MSRMGQVLGLAAQPAWDLSAHRKHFKTHLGDWDRTFLSERRAAARPGCGWAERIQALFITNKIRTREEAFDYKRGLLGFSYLSLQGKKSQSSSEGSHFQ